MKYALIALLVGLLPKLQALEPKALPFFFGASNAAFQVEGSPADSDWREWTHTKHPDGTPHISDLTDAEVATDFWNRYEEDFALAKVHGINAFRMSIAWERIEPQAGKWNQEAIAHYSKMMASMRKHGLEPFVTLNHYVLPLWVSRKGGVTWNEFPKYFARYAKHVVAKLAAGPGKPTYFMTINEPNIQVRFGYLDARKFPPGVNDATLAVKALAGLAKGHIAAVNQIRSLRLRGVKIGLAHNWQVFLPLDKRSKADVTIADQVDWMFNRAFMEAIITGKIHFAMPYAKPIRESVALFGGRPALDFLGVQNYGRSYVTPSKQKPGYVLSEGTGPQNDLGWELVPDALYHSVKQSARYGFPVIVTETGLADHADKQRSQYLKWNFDAIRKLRAERVPLFGYIHWSLTDNFEWAFGLTPRFGLVDVDYKTLKRLPRASLKTYADLISDFRKAN